jgi:hypothetical protein
MASRTSGLTVTIAGDAKGLQKAVDQADRSLKKLSDSADTHSKKSAAVFGAIGGAAAVGFGKVADLAGEASRAVFEFGKVSLASASDVNESITKNQQLFGRYAKEIQAFAKTSATAFGISRRAALEYTGVFGNLSRALGISKKDSADMSIRLTKLAADLASFNNTSIDDALEALRSGLVGEVEPLRRYGVTLSAVAVQAEAVRTGIVKSTVDMPKYTQAVLHVEDAQKKSAAALKQHGQQSLEYRKTQAAVSVAQEQLNKITKGSIPQLNAQQKALASVHLIMRQTKNAQGDFARTSGGLANQQRILKARFEDLKTTVGQALLPVMARGIRTLNNFITGMQKGTGAGGDFARTMRTVGGVLGPIVKTGAAVISFFGRHKNAMTAATSAALPFIDALKAVNAALKGIESAARGVAKAVGAVGSAFGSVKGAVSGAVGA